MSKSVGREALCPKCGQWSPVEWDSALPPGGWWWKAAAGCPRCGYPALVESECETRDVWVAPPVDALPSGPVETEGVVQCYYMAAVVDPDYKAPGVTVSVTDPTEAPGCPPCANAGNCNTCNGNCDNCDDVDCSSNPGFRDAEPPDEDSAPR